MTDKDLITKCINKDLHAWHLFCKQYNPLVTKTIKYKTYKLGLKIEKNEILDISQEIFLLIWEKNKLATIKDVKCLKSWLVIVTLNTTSNYCRKNIFKIDKITSSLFKTYTSEDKNTKTLESIISCPKFNTSKIIENNEISNLLNTEISKLNYKQQLAITFNLYEGKTQKDIAKIMNIPKGTVATLIKRAKQHLRNKLKDTLDF